MMPPSLRGQGAAIYLFIVNLLGLGIGPVATGWLTQHVFANDKLVHYSLTTVALFSGLIAATAVTAGIQPFLNARRQLDTPAPALARQTSA
jgi:short subunit fatty acids transporter